MSLARSERTILKPDDQDPAGSLVRRLGITRASDIDLEAIAQSVGVRVRVGTVETCEARLIGFRDRAIITVGPTGDRRRRRFSIAHELGHWHLHRGRITLCETIGLNSPAGRKSPMEREADDYAAKLLMPSHLFRNSLQRRSHRTLGVAAALSHEYRTSRLATLLRIIDLDLWPCMLIFHPAKGKGWSRRSRSFQIKARLNRHVDRKAVITVEAERDLPRTKMTEAANWFVGEQGQLTEQSCRTFGGGVLTLLVSGQQR
jgi:Zn-dependent peptidase ImmA (M78 family)